MPRSIVSLLLAFLFACSPLRYAEQELFLAHDAKADVLRLSIVYDAIQIGQAEGGSLFEAPKSSDQRNLAAARRAAIDISDGRRAFMIMGFPGYFDLEEAWSSEEGEEDLDIGENEREWVELAKDVRVIDSGYCRGAQDRLSLYQQLEFPHASRWIAKLEREFLGLVEQLADSGEFEKSTTWLDARSRELWIAMAREKRGWLSLKDGMLTVDLPVTSACAASWISRAAKLQKEDAGVADALDQMFSHLTELRIADDHLVLGWKLEGLIWTFRSKADGHDERLAQSLRDSGSTPKTLRSSEEVTASWRKR